MHAGSWPPPVAADADWPGSRFVVGPGRRALARSYGRVLLAEVTVVAAALALSELALLVLALLFIVAMTALLARTTVRWLRGRDTVVELDASGIRVPACQVHVGWQEISAIRVRGRVVVFLAADPASVLARIPGRGRRAALRNGARYGSPIAISDRDLDCAAEEIVAAAEILAPLTLRRLDE